MGSHRRALRATIHEEDRISAAELLELRSLRQIALTGGELPDALKRRLKLGLTPQQKAVWHEQMFTDALMAQDYAIAKMRTTDDPQVMRIAWNAVQDAKDRVMGKPTEKLQVAQAVRIQVGGIDLDALPGTTGERTSDTPRPVNTSDVSPANGDGQVTDPQHDSQHDLLPSE